MANEMASLPASLGAAPNTPTPSISFHKLPSELYDQIFEHLQLVHHQISFTRAVVLAIGEGRAYGYLVRVFPDDFFLHWQNRNSLFCNGGITGHNAKNPILHPTQEDKDLVNNSAFATTFNELIALAGQQHNTSAARLLKERKRAGTAKYLRKAVLSSRNMRRDALKPSARSKRELGLEARDTRSYTQLLVEHNGLSERYRAIQDAKEQDESEEIVSGHNLETLEKLCCALLEDSPGCENVCRGCCDPELSRYTTWVDRVLRAGSAEAQRIFLPVGSSCRALYLEGSMIEASSLSIFQDRRAQRQIALPNYSTSWFRPQLLGSGSQAFRYYSKEEVAVLRTPLCRPDDDPRMIEDPASVPDVKIGEACHRYKCSQDAMQEIAVQYLRNNGRVSGINIRGQEIADLSTFMLPAWFMVLLHEHFDMDVDTMLFAQRAASFVSAYYDAHSDLAASDEGLWRRSAVAAFWREHTEEELRPHDWLEMHEAMNIVVVPSWEKWLPIGSSLLTDAHFVETATAYCLRIHQLSPADVMKARATDLQQNLAIFETFVIVSDAILDSYEAPAVRTTMDVMAAANGVALNGSAEEIFQRFFDTMFAWWEQFGPISDPAAPNWLDDVASRFWADSVHFKFSIIYRGGLSLASGLMLRGITSDNPLHYERAGSTRTNFAKLPDVLFQAEAQGLFAWY